MAYSGGTTSGRTIDARRRVANLQESIDKIVDRLDRLHDVHESLLAMAADSSEDDLTRLSTTLTEVDRTVVHFEIKLRRLKMLQSELVKQHKTADEPCP